MTTQRVSSVRSKKQRSSATLAFSLFVVLASACGPGGDLQLANEGALPLVENGGVIGDAGGMIAGDDQASVRVPAGALAQDTRIWVEALEDLDGVLPTGDPGSFAGGVVLEPEGTTFAEPVQITIPLVEPHEPGRQMRLFFWDGVSTVWEETASVGTVGDDGWTATADVAHFSFYILQPSGLEAEDLGIFGDVEGTVFKSTLEGGDLADAARGVFQEVIESVEARFVLGSKTPFDPPDETSPGLGEGLNCYSVTGMSFRFEHVGAAGFSQVFTDNVGETDDFELRIDYFRTVDSFSKVGENEVALVGQLDVMIFWLTTPPELTIAVDEDRLWTGEYTPVTATLTCGGVPMADQDIEFALAESRSTEPFSPSTLTTSEDGTAISEFTAITDLPREFLVEALYFWSNVDGDDTDEVASFVEVTVDSLAGEWSGSGEETVRGCEDSEDNGTFSATVPIIFEHDLQQVTSTKWFSDGSADLQASVQRVGETQFSIDGTVNLQEQYTDCFADGCETFTTLTRVAFAGTGSFTTGVFDVQWEGNDVSGDTCTSNGMGTLTRSQP